MNYIIDKEQYQQLKAAWKKAESHSASEMIVYNILRGFDAKRGFSPITNPRKLANGMREWFNFEQANYACNWMIRPLVQTRFTDDEQFAKNVARQKESFKDQYGVELTDELREKILTKLKEA